MGKQEIPRKTKKYEQIWVFNGWWTVLRETQEQIFDAQKMRFKAVKRLQSARNMKQKLQTLQGKQRNKKNQEQNLIFHKKRVEKWKRKEEREESVYHKRLSKQLQLTTNN